MIAVCDRCGKHIWSGDSVGDSTATLCKDCYDNYYHRCFDCGCLIHNDDTYYVDDDSDGPCCGNCIDQHRREIQSYCYKPAPIFYGEGFCYLGVELEIDDGGEVDSVPKKLMDIGSGDAEHIYIKCDGSQNRGMEIVTHPMQIYQHLTDKMSEDGAALLAFYFNGIWLLPKNFTQSFSEVTFCRMDEVETCVAESNFKKNTKEAMMRLAQLLQRKHKALKGLEKAGVSTGGLLDQFIELGISPIPLWQNLCVKQIPGPVELLRDISSREIPVKYGKAKFK